MSMIDNYAPQSRVKNGDDLQHLCNLFTQSIDNLLNVHLCSYKPLNLFLSKFIFLHKTSNIPDYNNRIQVTWI